jgi:pimeloyl-ACP methyl ester carboxylesterase
MTDSKLETSRRNVLVGGSAVLAASAGATQAGAQAVAPPVTFVLVHGSWHGGWCYSRVAAILRAKGHTVFTPTLTGLADRSHLLNDSVNLDTHVTDLVNLIDWYDLNDFVLCGHSYGGMPTTATADRRADRIRSIFLLDAFVPNDGQSLVEVAGVPMPTTPTQPAPPASAFVETQQDWAWVNSKLTPHPNGSRTQKTKLTGAWLKVPKKTYIRVPDNKSPVFDATLERLSKDPGWKTGNLPHSGHDAMIDQPQVLADLLEQAA